MEWLFLVGGVLGIALPPYMTRTLSRIQDGEVARGRGRSRKIDDLLSSREWRFCLRYTQGVGAFLIVLAIVFALT
jgi:hypothetical protein